MAVAHRELARLGATGTFLYYNPPNPLAWLAVRALHTSKVRKGVAARFPDALENLPELRHGRETDAPATVLKLRDVRREAKGW